MKKGVPKRHFSWVIRPLKQQTPRDWHFLRDFFFAGGGKGWSPGVRGGACPLRGGFSQVTDSRADGEADVSMKGRATPWPGIRAPYLSLSFRPEPRRWTSPPISLLLLTVWPHWTMILASLFVPSVGTLCIGHGGTLLTRAAEAHALTLKNFRNVLSSSNTSILIGHKLLSPEIISTKG